MANQNKPNARKVLVEMIKGKDYEKKKEKFKTKYEISIKQLKYFCKGFLDINRIPTSERIAKNDSERLHDPYLDCNTGSYGSEHAGGMIMGAICEVGSFISGLAGILAYTVNHDNSPETIGAIIAGIPVAACVMGNLASCGYEVVRNKYLEAKGRLETKCGGEGK